MTGAVTQVKKTFNAKDLELSIINSLIGNMVLIKAGSFIMGNNKAPILATYSHSASVGNRNFLPLITLSFRIKRIASSQLTFSTGQALQPL